MSYIKLQSCMMKPLRGRVKTKLFVGFDVETVNDVFYSGGLWWIDKKGVERWFYRYDKQELIDKLLSPYFTDYAIIATNLSYDFNSVFYGTPEWNTFNKIIMRGSRFIYADWRPKTNRKITSKESLHNNRSAKKGRIMFFDTLNYAMMGVEKLGRIIGLKKLDAPNFLGDRAPTNDMYCSDINTKRCYSEKHYFELYNKRDCMVSAMFMDLYQRAINELGGNLKMTAASTSLDLYRRGYQRENVIKEEYVLQDENIKDFIYDAYYGGRTEAFSRGCIDGANYYDINSLYPAVMRNPMPLPQSVKLVVKTDKTLIHRYMGVTECDVYVPETMKYPPLPLKRDKLLFPTGRFRGTWNNNELVYAMSLGVQVLRVHKQIIYQESHTPFKEYVEDLYAKRLSYKAAGSPFEVIVKLMMNSLYGKFAMRYLEDWRVFTDDNMPFEFKKELYKKNSTYEIEENETHVVFRKQKTANSVFTFPIYSSYITSYARILIHRYAMKHNALYMDTDSVITFDTIPTSDGLGFMKEEEIDVRGVVVKPKFYLLNEKPKIKGLSKATNKDFFTLIDGGIVNKLRFSTLKESVRRGILPNTSMIVPKRMSVEDNKRLWSEDFDPLVLQESKPLLFNEVEV